jgi:hypothetical protein
MEKQEHLDWLQEFATQTKTQGFVAAWAASAKEAFALGSRHIFSLQGETLLNLLKQDTVIAQHLVKHAPIFKSLFRKLTIFERLLVWIKKIFQPSSDRPVVFQRHAEVKEHDGSGVLYHQLVFQNWGRTVKNTPAITFIPKTKEGVCNIVRWAKANDKRVRAAGYRHTWGDLYSEDNQVLISSLSLDIVDQLPAKEPAIDPNNELQGIEIVGRNADGKALCKIGAATTNEQFRRWCLDPNGGNWNWTVPLNVIMVEITWGGSNAPICHGAGSRHKTLSDLVTAVEFVNAKGVIQVVDDPGQLKAAAGCFGLLGYVTSITLALDAMTFANMKPLKQRVALTIPPPKGIVLPAEIDMSGITPEDLDTAWHDFVARCEQDYYAEWFWFPYQKECWINTWKNDGAKADAHDYPGPFQSFIQEAEEYLAQLANDTVFRLLPGRLQAELTGHLAMSLMPSQEIIVAPLIDALHFRRGIQNMRVLDMELEIPIPRSAEDTNKPDWSVCQQAWWMVITDLYQRKDAPMRVALEMRVMADSDIAMAPQFGNKWGTCSIEVLSTANTNAAEWTAYMQDITNRWMSITDTNGNSLNVRPHWAKMWQGLKFNGSPANDYLKNTAYKDQIPLFKLSLQAVAQAGGYTLKECQKLFSNSVLDNVFEQVFD